MAYKLFAPSGEEIKLHNLQDKAPWCKTGASFEDVFVEKYGGMLNLAINPEKKTNPYAPDLINTVTGNLGDLKTQNTPFFQAKSRYNLNPQFAVTFNDKDFHRYAELYPSIEIYFWVVWVVTGFEGSTKINVAPMEGVWYAPFSDLAKMIAKAPLHPYQQRVNDNQGNAKGSYVLNLQDPLFRRMV